MPAPLVTGYRLPQSLEGTILEEIVETKLREVAGAKQRLPAESMEKWLERAPEVRSLKAALLGKTPAVIAEIKKASPSAGILRPDFDPAALAAEYQRGGAAAISVLTEVHHFQGSLEILADLRWRCRLPLLRKDFILDPYQLVESRYAGADAVLVIAALHPGPLLAELRRRGEELGMEVLVEVHDEAELERALAGGATLVGVNSRDLRTFEVSLDVCFRLAPRIPKGVVAVAESGIRNATDLQRLQEAGFRGFLIGEQLMRAASPGTALAALRAHARVGGKVA
jgi:indole-3-glycerol phosphate synthase